MEKPPSCVGCPLYNQPMVWGDGSPNSQLIILGQNPGPDEVREGRPFVGAAGRILDHAIRHSGNFRSKAYITNTVKCFVAPKKPVPEEAVRKCRPLLEQEFKQVANASTILTLGQEAFHAIAPSHKLVLQHDRRTSRKDSSIRLRGCVEPLEYPRGRAFRVVPTLHPIFLAYSGFADSNTFQSDVAKAYRISDPAYVFPRRSFNTNPSSAEIDECIGHIIYEGQGGVDIETPLPEDIPEDDRSSSGLLPVSVIGLSPDTRTVVAVSRDQFGHLRPLFDLASRGSLPDTKPLLWAFNSSFDFYHLGPLYSLDGVTEACAMTLFHLLHPDSKRKDLATMMSLYTDLPFHKHLQDLQPDFYNASDTWGVLEGSVNMIKKVRKIDHAAQGLFKWVHRTLESLFWDRMMPVVKTVRHWEFEGAAYDEELSDRLLLESLEVLSTYEDWWDANIPTFSWRSPKQLVELFTALGAPVPKRRRVKKDKSVVYTPSVDDLALASFQNLSGAIAETAKLIILMRGYKKASDFTGLGTNGRIYCRAKPHGQVGGRIQTVDRNMQQIPERCPEFDLEVYPELAKMPFIEPRRTVVPDDRTQDVIISADYSQIEFWLYAWYSKCKRALEIKESGDYLYGSFYEDIWKERFFNPTGGRGKSNRADSVPPWKLLVAKSWPLGFIYGRGVPDPKDQGLPIDKFVAKRVYDGFHREYSEFSVFHRELEFLVNRAGYLQTAFGRLRPFPNPKGQRNEYLAFPGQTSAVDVLIRNALLPLSTLLPRFFGPRSRVLFTVHDSVINNITVAGSLRKAQEAYHLVKTTLEQPVEELDGFILPCEVKIGPSWGEGMSWEQFEVRYRGTYTQ